MNRVLAVVWFAWSVAAVCFGGTSAPSPLVHYTFDEGSGTVAVDQSGHGHDGVLHNVSYEDFGVHGHCVRLTGKDSYISLPVHPELELKRHFTLSIFFKMESGRDGLSLFNYGNYRNGWSSYVFRTFVAFVSMPAKLSAVCYRNFPVGTDRIRPFVNLTVVGDVDPKNPSRLVVRYYVDGKLTSSKNRVHDFYGADALPVRKDRAITIGKYASYESRSFKGLLDEVKIFDRSLNDKEVKADYEHTIAYRPSNRKIQAPKLVDRSLPAIARRRLAVYRTPNVPWARPEIPVEWFVREAGALGCSVRVLDSRELCDQSLLTPEHFDTLILTSQAMPIDAEDSIFKFLAKGGNLITTTVLPDVFKYDAAGKFLTINGRKTINHTRGWNAPFLLRNMPEGYGRRPVREALVLNRSVAMVTGKLLPALFPADPKLHFAPLDTWNKLSDVDGGYGGDGTNYAMAGDHQVDLYQEASGIGADFAVHRYYNARLFGATLVQLGRIGTRLLKGKGGRDVLQAVLLLMEHLPDEQSREYYQRIVDVHVAWSELGFSYTAAVAALRDAAIYAQLQDRDWDGCRRLLDEVEKRHQLLTKMRRNQSQLLAAKSQPEPIAKATAELQTAMAEARRFYEKETSAARASVASVPVPAKKPVRHKYGTLPSIASLVLPTNLWRMRGPLFDTMKRIGVNVYSGSLGNWQSDDLQVRRKMDGMMFDYKFVYTASPRFKTGGGAFNPADGKVKDAPLIPYPYEKIERELKGWFANKKWLEGREFRIGSCDETGLGYRYWGSAARHDFHGYLARHYRSDVAAMNRQCGTHYRHFAEVDLPVRQPRTPAEHAVWEHWRRCRELKLESFYVNLYNQVKRLKPDLDVFQLPSTGATAFPGFAVNYYNVTRYQDVNGMDGTCAGSQMEWLVNDLTTKRTLTSEWGGLYQESSLLRVNGQLWEELTGGALGFEQHHWSFGDESCNYADYLDYPTNYGAMLQLVLKDTRKLDFLFLDGRRTEPEVGILFSQTSRVHDQPWGWAGEKTFSPHMHTVSAYYQLFLRFGRSARVIADERLADGYMPQVKVLVVPHACYLSPVVQRRLLDYVRQGGRLVLEGRSGECDNFGAPADLLFRGCQVVPAFTTETCVVMDSARLAIAPGERVFSPSGKGRILARFGAGNQGAPAILTADLGGGSITYLGFAPGLRKYSAFAPVVERIFRSFGLSERFRLSNDEVLLREWLHDGDTYLLLSVKGEKYDHDWHMQEVELAVRGRVELEDYLFGTPMKGSYRDGYTHFKTLVVNGGRVYRVTGGKITPALDRRALAQTVRHPLKSQAGVTDESQPIALPFKGELMDVKPLRNGEYIFALTTLGSGDNSRRGESYLRITGPGELQKKRIFEGETYFFRMRRKIFKIKVDRCFYMYPFHSNLRIEEVAALPAGKGTRVERKDKVLRLANGMLRLEFMPESGIVMRSMQLESDRKDQLLHDGGSVVSGVTPGPFVNQVFDADVHREKNGVRVVFTQKTASQDRRLVQTIAMPDDCAGFTMENRCRNVKDSEAAFDFRYRPEMVLGGAASTEDSFFVPLKAGVRKIGFRGLNADVSFKPAAGWAAIVDGTERLAYVNLFPPEQVGRVYIWEGSNYYTFEIFTPRQKVPTGQTLDLDLDFLFIHGLTGVDQVAGRTAAYLEVPPMVNQRRGLKATLQLGTAWQKKAPAKMTVRLTRDGKTVQTLAENLVAEVAFDLPLAVPLQADGQTLPDGDYHLEVTAETGTDRLIFARPVTLCGQMWEDMGRKCEKLADGLQRQTGRLPEERLFALRIELENLRRDIAEGEFQKAQKRMEVLQTALK